MQSIPTKLRAGELSTFRRVHWDITLHQGPGIGLIHHVCNHGADYAQAQYELGVPLQGRQANSQSHGSKNCVARE